MKSILLNLMLLCCATMLGANVMVDIPSEIKAVTVYARIAQVHRAGETLVPAGQSTLKFVGLSPELTASSVQFAATGNFTILSVNYRRDYVNTPEDNAEIQALRRQIEAIDEQIRRIDIDVQVLKEEEALLLANKQIGGQQNGVQLGDLQAIAAYYRERLKVIKTGYFELELRQKEQTEERQKLSLQLQQLAGGGQRKMSGEVWVTVIAERPVRTQYQLSYMVNRAGWKPAYDIRVAEIGEDVELKLKAEVFQMTGEDWSQVALTLSTGRPTDGSTKPSLTPWRLVPFEPVAYQSAPREKNLYDQALENRYAARSDAAAPPPPPPPPAEYAAVEQFARATTQEYRIAVPHDIPADGKEHTVQVKGYALPADYQYYVAPKLDKDVFLTAKVSGWDEYQLLSGPANVFFEGSFLGSTQLQVSQTSDTLDVSLGRDRSIVVTRTKDEQFKDKQFIGNKVTQNTGWKIELRNSKTRAVSILVEDQYPISTTEEIEVTLESARGATVDRETGKLSWQVNLTPGQSETLRFRYDVKYPKKMQLPLE